MNIEFESELDCTFAISQNVIWKGKKCDELMWAEINTKKEGYYLHWEDDWANKIFFATIGEAKGIVLRDYFRHKPHINGRAFELNENNNND